MTHTTVSRRVLLTTAAAAGGGMVLGVFDVHADARLNPSPWLSPTDRKDGVELNHWLVIDPDGFVTVRIAAMEMGQGALTSGAMIVADELAADWNKVRAEQADPNRHIVDGYAYGKDPKVFIITASNHIVTTRRLYQQAGASARERLREAAAQAWGVPRAEVIAKDSMLRAGSRSATYGEFATRAATIRLAEEPKIKTPDQFTLVGTAVARLDTPVKVNGSAQYGIDTRLPGMVYAAVQSSPVPGGRLVSYDFDAIKNRPGVIRVVELKAKEPNYPRERPWADQYDPATGRGGHAMRNGIAVVADSWYRAKTALDLMPKVWDPGAGANATTESMFASRRALLNQPGQVLQNDGNALDIIATASKVVTADYERPYMAHAPMEPMNATVAVANERVDVWVGSQSPVIDLDVVAEQTGIDAKKVFVHNTFLGGGFGRRGVTGASTTRQAAEIARQVGKPVKLVWSREEDIGQCNMRSMAVCRLTAALGPDGLLQAAATHTVAELYYGRSGLRLGYPVVAQHRQTHVVDSHIPTTYLRSPTGALYTFMTESFADELALAAGMDPLEWRMRLTKDLPREQLLLKTLKEKSGFRTDLPRGEGMGVAVALGGSTMSGQCATVSVSRRGQLRVEKIVAVVLTGNVVNPKTVVEQVESCIVYELSHTLRGEIDIREGKVANANFDNFHVLRMPEMPELEVHLITTPGDIWGGIGEPAGAPPPPAAVANAIYFATGKRIRSTPILKHDLSWA